MNTRLQPYLLLALCWVICLTSSTVFAQDSNVYEGDLKFFTQAELDTFSYERVTGDLTIGSFSDISGTGTSLITDLSPLQTLKRVDGTLLIGLNNNISTLKGLENLCRVGGPFLIYGNDQLTTLEGLDRLHYVGGDLTIEINDHLQSLNGLEKLESVQGNIYIVTNDALTTLSGLDNLRKVGESLTIVDNNALINLEGLGGLDSIGSLSLGSNDEISSLSGLNPSVTILGYANFNDNSKLAECCIILNNVQGEVRLTRNATGCNSLTEVQQACSAGPGEVDCAGEVTLTTQAEVDAFECTSVKSLTIDVSGTLNDPICNLKALCSLQSIAGDLIISDNEKTRLSTLEGLQGLTSIGGDFTLDADIPSVEGLDNLKTIGGKLYISSGPTNLVGLGKLESIGGALEVYEAGLENFQGLNSLKTIGSRLSIYRAPVKSFKGLDNLVTIQGPIFLSNLGISSAGVVADVSFEGLSSLTSVGGIIFDDQFVAAQSFRGLESLKTIRGELRVSGTDGLYIGSLQGLEGVEEITGDINFSYQGLKNFQGLNNLQRIGGDILLEDNRFEGFDGLEKLTEIEGEIIALNNQINNVKGLQGLQTAGGISIADEPLASLDGLQQLRQINGNLSFQYTGIAEVTPLVDLKQVSRNLVIRGNTSLFDCCLLPSLVDKVAGEIILESNAASCNSLEAIVESCDNPIVEVDCAEQEVVLTTQARVDAFFCTTVSNLTINLSALNDPITDLTPLRSLVAVEENLTINMRGKAVPLGGFDNLERIGGVFYVSNAPSLSFESFGKLSSVGSTLQLSSVAVENFNGLKQIEELNGFVILNSEVGSFTGLEGLQQIQRNFFLDNVSRLTNFEGLSNLRVVAENFNVTGPDFVNFVGLSRLKSAGGIIIRGRTMTAFTGFEGLEALESITNFGGLSVYQVNISSLRGLENVRVIEDNFFLSDNSIQSLEGLDNLSEIKGNVTIQKNNDLTNLEGLNSVATIGGGIDVSDNKKLVSLQGLESLVRVDGRFFWIYLNEKLNDLSPLKSIENIGGDLGIYQNPSLTECCIIPSLIAATQGKVTISDNSPECSSLEAIAENCAQETTAEKNSRTAQDLHAFPNPSENFVQIRVDQPTFVQLFNTSGYLMKEQRIEQEGTIDLSTISAGVYLLKAPGRKVQRIIKK